VFPIGDSGDWHEQVWAPDSVLPQRSSRNLLEQLNPVKQLLPQRNLDKRLNGKFYRWMMVLAGYFESPRDSRKTFAMRKIDSGTDRLALQCYRGTYFDAIDSSESLEWELLSAIPALKSSMEGDLTSFDRTLSLRKALHRDVSDPVMSGDGRCAGIGISTLIAYQDDDELKLMLKKRSSTTVASHPGGIHVIPSGMFQQFSDEVDKEFSIVHTVLREYLEEVFNVPESDYFGAPAQSFYGDSRIEYLLSLIDDGKAGLYLSGIAVNLLTLRPEVCTLLWIRDEAWWQHHSRDSPRTEHIHINKEFESAYRSKTAVGSVPYRDSDEELLEETALDPIGMVPSGAAAFWLGVDTLRNLMKPGATRSA